MSAPTRLDFPDGSYSAWITLTSSGQPAPVYGITKSEDGRKMTGYIEAKTGEAFVIHSEGTTSQPLVTRPYGDGMSWGGGYGIDAKIQNHPNGRFSVTFDGLQDTATTERPFMFSNLNLTDNVDHATSDETFIKNLGTVQVKLFRTYSLVQTKNPHDGDAAPEQQLVHEKAKKALVSHATGLGAARFKPARGLQMEPHFIDHPTFDAPYRSFTFHYLSRDLLEIQGLVDAHIAAEPAPERAASPSCAVDQKPKKIITISIDDSDDEDGRLAKKVKREPEVKVEVKTRETVGKDGRKVLVIEDSDDE